MRWSVAFASLLLADSYEALRRTKVRGIHILSVGQNVRRSLQEADSARILEAGWVALCGTCVALREEGAKRAYFDVRT
jgi:ABC-type branched-subunit amino acid transport system ATPase component